MKSTLIFACVVIPLILVGCGLVGIDQANGSGNHYSGNSSSPKAPITIYWDLVLQFIIAQLGIAGVGNIKNRILKKGVNTNDKH